MTITVSEVTETSARVQYTMGYPMNGNGTLGYGATAKQEFTTSAGSSSSVKTNSVPAKREVTTIRPVTVGQAREVLSR